MFTTPHCHRVDGHVASTRPLSYLGTLIDGIRVEFCKGRIVGAQAATGEPVLRKLLETDEGASRLGEVALVPHSSLVSKTGLLFYNTLFDENAASHIALGQALRRALTNGRDMSSSELTAAGANKSMIHVDWMIGSEETDVDGIPISGPPIPLMRRGEWV